MTEVNTTNRAVNDPFPEYVHTRSPEAFKQIVDEHVDAVFSQCVRQLRDRALAEDVTQTVFVILAQKAAGLSAGVVLGGWLFNTTRNCCAAALRAEARRRRREQKAARMRCEIAEGPNPVNE